MRTIKEIKTKEKFEIIDIGIAYFFGFLDFLAYIIILFILKSKNKFITLLKYKLFILLINDIIFRISYIKIYFFIPSLAKDLIHVLLSSSQFYIILSFLEEALKNIQTSRQDKNVENLQPFQKTIFFFFVIFPYNRYSHGFKKIIYLFENLIVLGCIFKIYGYIRNKVFEIVLILRSKNNKNECIFNYIEYFTINSLIFFSIYYILKIATIFIDNPIILIYSNIIIILIKETGKYLTFILLGLILYSMEKYVFENNISKLDIKSPEQITKINQV